MAIQSKALAGIYGANLRVGDGGEQLVVTHGHRNRMFDPTPTVPTISMNGQVVATKVYPVGKTPRDKRLPAEINPGCRSGNSDPSA